MKNPYDRIISIAISGGKQLALYSTPVCLRRLIKVYFLLCGYRLEFGRDGFETDLAPVKFKDKASAGRSCSKIETIRKFQHNSKAKTQSTLGGKAEHKD